MTFDLNTLALKETFELTLKHPATESTLFADEEQTKPLTITLQGTSSKAYRNALNALQNRQLKRNGKKATAEVMQEEAVTLLASVSVKATNFDYKGEALDNADTFRALYNDAKFSWVKTQVDEALAQIENFM